MRNYYIVFFVEDDYLSFLLGKESGFQQITTNFSTEFIEDDRNVIFCCSLEN
jgi:hypothetical protein